MALVTRQDDNGLAILSLNRPEALNALSPSLFVELDAHVQALNEQSEEIGVVILRGEGRSFSAGNDLKAIQSGDVPPVPTFQSSTIDLIENLPQPVICAVQGHCYTGALELALAADLIVAGESAKFCDTHGKWGHVAEVGHESSPAAAGRCAAGQADDVFGRPVPARRPSPSVWRWNACPTRTCWGMSRRWPGRSWRIPGSPCVPTRCW